MVELDTAGLDSHCALEISRAWHSDRFRRQIERSWTEESTEHLCVWNLGYDQDVHDQDGGGGDHGGGHTLHHHVHLEHCSIW